ncbi:MAG: hypothetical protein WC211_10380 [Dehalococcoidia bacterium]
MTLQQDASARLGTGYAREVRVMLGSALVLFVWTVVIGILNGVDVIDFDHKVLLTHLHVGTLGWISTAVFAATLYLFDGPSTPQSRALAWATPVVAVAYNIAFLTTTSVVRPIVGTAMVVVMVLFAAHALWGLLSRGREGRVVSVPHLAMAAALFTVVLGGLFGVLLGLQFAGRLTMVGIGEAHPAVMVVGFLVPAGMGYAELALRPGSASVAAGWAGRLQIGLPFLGALMAAVGFLSGQFALVQAGLPLEIIGTLIFLVRLVPTALRTSLLADTPQRYGIPPLVFLPVNIAILVSIIARYAPDLTVTPVRQFEAMDHAIFVGVMTFAIFGVVQQLVPPRRSGWHNQFMFWGMLVGVSLFVVGLLLDVTPLLHSGTPLLGLAILAGVGVYAPRLLREG